MSRWLFAWMLLAGCHDGGPDRAAEVFATPFSTREAPLHSGSALAPLPEQLALDPQKIALGARLFRDPRLSGDGKVACSDCHDVDHGGADGRARAELPERKPGAVNVPSIFNQAFNFRFGWAGGFADIGEQLDVAIAAAHVMASSWDKAARALARDGQTHAAFAAIYGEGPSAAHVRDAVAVYSLSLITPNARFDRYLRGELTLEPEEQRGYELFCDHGCVSCHQGVNVGGNMLQVFGVMQDYFAERGELRPADLGLFAFTSRAEDRHVFRVPSLRNVALTAPYFHDASAATLEEAATIMARYQLGRTLSPEQASLIATFLRTLTGELEGKTL